MFKELLLCVLAIVVTSFCQDASQTYILGPTQNPSVPQWGWGGSRYGVGGYWVRGPTGWTWTYPRGWWGWNSNWNNNWNNNGNNNWGYGWANYWSTPAPGKK